MAELLNPTVLASLRQLTPPGEPDVLSEVLGIFLREVPTRIERLRTSFAGGNIQEVQRAAHSLKGSAGNIGAERLQEAARQVDEKARTGDGSGLQPLIDTMVTEFGKVEGEIRRLMNS